MPRYLSWVVGFALATGAGLGLASLAPSESRSPETASEAAPVQPFQGEPGPIIRQEKQADLDLSMVISPGYAGTNDLSFYMIDTDRDWKDVQRFFVRFTQAESGRRQEYDLEQLHEGHFPLDQFSLALAGRWVVEVTVLRTDTDETRFRFAFALSHP